MDFENLLKELKTEIVSEAKEKFGSEGEVIVSDLKVYLDSSKVKLKRWSILFVQGSLHKDELQWLLKSQKDLLTMNGLVKIGVNKIKAGHFKSKVIGIVFDKLVGTVTPV
jgi:hypothetical protein